MARPRNSTPPHVKRVRAKGHTYYYFDTGKVKANGKPILKRLPDIADKASFGGSYAAMLAHRTRALNVAPVMTIAELINRYQRSREFRMLSESTQRTYNIYLQQLHEKIGVAPAGEVVRRDVVALMDGMAERPGAANMMLSVIGALYAWGRPRELTNSDPTKDVDSFAARDYEPWPNNLLAEALQSDDRKVRLIVSLLYFTAQRVGDVARMRWSDIRGGVLFVTQEKTGKALEIPVHPDLSLALGARPNKDRPLVAKESGGHYAKSSIRGILQLWASKRGNKIVAHGLRKNAVNALLEAGCSVGEVSSVSGQSLALVEHYAKRRSNRKLAVSAIGRLQGAKHEQENQ